MAVPTRWQTRRRRDARPRGARAVALRRGGPALVLLLTLSFGIGCEPLEPLPLNTLQVQVDYAAFLAQHDPVWAELPTRWEDGPFIGNGTVGAVAYATDDGALRWELGRSDVVDHRGNDMALDGRLPVGHFELRPTGTLDGGELRLHLHDAEVRGSLQTSSGELTVTAYAHAERDLLVFDVQAGPGETDWALTWEPATSVVPRIKYVEVPGYTEADLTNPPPTRESVGNTELSIQPLDVGGQYVTAWRVVPLGEGRSRVYVTIASSHPDDGARAEALETIANAVAEPPQDLDASHRGWWHEHYPASFVSIPDTRMEGFYWIQIYKLASASRADGPLFDNMGPWYQDSQWPGAWWNIEVQMSYWPTYTANRPSVGGSLCRTLYEGVDTLIANVPEPYRADSAGISRESNLTLSRPIGTGTNIDEEAPEYGNLIWALHNCWLEYRHSMDDQVLREDLFPLLKRAVGLYLHLVEEGDDGKLHLPISLSPEAGATADANYDLAGLRWGLETLLWAADRLQVDDPLVPRWREVRDELVDYPRDDYGYRLGTDATAPVGHRHWSHLFMIHPYRLVTWDEPDMQQVIRDSTEHWFDEGSGFDEVMFRWVGLSSLRSSMYDGDGAWEALEGAITIDSLNSMIGANTFHTAFERGPVHEGPLGAANALQEMLLQSHGNVLRVFPAVPEAWPDLVFHDLSAEGAFLVSAVRRDGVTQVVRVRSRAGEPATVRTGMEDGAVVGGPGADQVTSLGNGEFELRLTADTEVIFRSVHAIEEPTVVPLDADPTETNFYGIP
ncbi:MAG: glycosyl hydrolase family 95 catalytic domain-containing protein [Myxococcota bacterium]